MNRELEYFLSMTENLHFDRKSARIKPKDIARHVIAFANAEGGNLLMGVEGDGKLTGTNYPGAHSLEEYELIIHQNISPLPVTSAEESPSLMIKGKKTNYS